ncbi:hypothetical protein MAM1_0074c04280 [Mucor ambiguus]|uniref:Uncharacterized protein n=1 Tax=Mucor ambiguus TaxID=91626 RepID=A0A0C9LUD1_9FUNG|nr:hypothetical protein MAM1_0074c04280 [Mucor ambiguus]
MLNLSPDKYASIMLDIDQQPNNLSDTKTRIILKLNDDYISRKTSTCLRYLAAGVLPQPSPSFDKVNSKDYIRQRHRDDDNDNDTQLDHEKVVLETATMEAIKNCKSKSNTSVIKIARAD